MMACVVRHKKSYTFSLSLHMYLLSSMYVCIKRHGIKPKKKKIGLKSHVPLAVQPLVGAQRWKNLRFSHVPRSFVAYNCGFRGGSVGGI